MIWYALVITAIFCQIEVGIAGTLKRKRDTGNEIILSDYNYLEASGILPPLPNDNDVILSFHVSYDKLFHEDLLNQDSNRFNKESRRLTKYMAKQIARNVGMVRDDVSVEVVSFSPKDGPSIAKMRVMVPGYFEITKEDLIGAVKDIELNGEVDGYPITEIQVDEDLDTETPEEPENVLIDLELIYQYDTSSGEIDLSSRESSDFISESLIIQQELSLHLVAIIAQTDIISPDQIKITVLSFRSAGENTAVTLTVEANGLSIDQLSNALNSLVIDDVGINGRLVMSIEELTRSITYEGDYALNYPETSIEVMPPHYGEEEPPPPDDSDFIHVDNHVMTSSDDSFMSEEFPSNVDDREPIPVDDDDIIFNEVMVNDDSLNSETSETEPFIPDVVPVRENEPVPSDDYDAYEPIPPFPGEFPDHCSSIQDPERGSVECTSSNDIGSQCRFSCNPNTRLEGAESIRCDADGSWDSAPPYCVLIYCQPHILNLEYGLARCSDHNVFNSVCSFTCSERHTLRGPTSIRCQYSGIWTENPPTCERDPIDCADEYGPWSICENGERVKEEVIIQMPGRPVVCPSLREECVDCELVWDEWSPCGDEIRLRTQIVKRAKVGAGKDCPEPETITEVCVHCVLEWEDWSECIDGERGRSQIVSVPSQGAGRKCEEQLEETEECYDCEVDWTAWSDCASGFRTRSQYVLFDSVGAGRPCPDLSSEEEDCVDCVMSWGLWSDCVFGSRERTQIIQIEPIGAGKACKDPVFEVKECRKCEVSWGPWEECSNGQRIRKQYMSQEPKEVDEECPEFLTESETCIDCVVAWGEWSECSESRRVKTQLIQQNVVGAGKPCPEMNSITEACVDCVMDWGEWSLCSNAKRTRSQIIVLNPIGAGQACADPQVEIEDCQNCVTEWTEWSACIENEKVRYEEIVEEQIGGGSSCHELQREVEACSNCVVDWSPWSTCENGDRQRQQFVLIDEFGGGTPCSELQFEREDCNDCQLEWGEWSVCSLRKRERHQYVVQQTVGGGEPCPVLATEAEDCVDCEIEWTQWSECEDGERSRSQFVSEQRVGAGAECPQLQQQTEVCIDCESEWSEWTECSNGQRSRSQNIIIEPAGSGKLCPPLETTMEVCVDCVVHWSDWTPCFQGSKSRTQQIITEPVSGGRECPPLQTETQECYGDSDQSMDELVCRFTERILGYKQRPQMRDILLIGDESGSIGWVNFDKIKNTFKAVSKTIRGGIGPQAAQIAMLSFAHSTRKLFMFDEYHDVTSLVEAIDQTYFLGGYRSKIGNSLTDANAWVFQQTGGMRSFPNMDDNIVHEILIATDGCRTSDEYLLKMGLDVIKKRGIKLYVLAVASKDVRCRETVKKMAEDQNDIFEISDWNDLDTFNELIERKSCVTAPISASRGDSSPDEYLTEEGAQE